MNMVNKTEDMIDKLQQLKGKTKLKFFKIINNYYIEMKNKNYQTHHEDPFSRNAQGISKFHHEILMLRNFLQTKLQFNNMNNNYYDLYYTVIKTRDDNNVNNENNENDFINFNDILTPNHYIGIKPREIILR